MLDKELAREIRGMASFRNLLVRYAEVDPEKVAEMLQNRLSDFEAFAGHVSRYLDTRPG